MKYKVGDAVRIKTWDDLSKEYNFALPEYAHYPKGIVLPGIVLPGGFYYSDQCEKTLQKKAPDRILIINEIRFINHFSDHCWFYYMEEMGWSWIDDEIETFIEPVYDRFEILDL